MLFSCTPVPGSITPEFEPLEIVIATVWAPSVTRMWVVPRTETGGAA